MSVSLSLKELRVERKIKNSNSNFNFRPANFARLEIISSKIEPLLSFLFLLQTSKRFRFHFFSIHVKKVKEVYPDDFYIYIHCCKLRESYPISTHFRRDTFHISSLRINKLPNLSSTFSSSLFLSLPLQLKLKL